MGKNAAEKRLRQSEVLLTALPRSIHKVCGKMYKHQQYKALADEIRG